MMKSVFMSFYVILYCIQLHRVRIAAAVFDWSVRGARRRGGSGRGALATMLSLPLGQRVAQP